MTVCYVRVCLSSTKDSSKRCGNIKNHDRSERFSSDKENKVKFIQIVDKFSRISV